MFDILKVKEQFPALNQKVNNEPLVYLDSAATSLKPKIVVDRLAQFYLMESANVHRGAHYLSQIATNEFEKSRAVIQKFLNAKSSDEIVFTKGTTEGINLIATSYGDTFLKEGDEIVLTELEHHANLVPWQVLAQKKKCILKYIVVDKNGELVENSIEQQITAKTKLVAFSACSNILGTITQIKKIIDKAKSVAAVTVMDAAQYVTQKTIDVQKLDIDFLTFSSHKIFGPFGFGVVYGKKEILDRMPPYQYGGSMISDVEYDNTTFNATPFKFEAGTPHVAGAIGTKVALEFFNQMNIQEVFEHEQKLMAYLVDELRTIPEIQLFGEAKEKAAIVSFNIQEAHHSDIGQILDQQGIAVRVGHHCTQPLLKKFNLTGTVRASISVYNNENDIQKLVDGLKKAKRMLL